MFTERVFRVLDHNSDGLIDFSEFVRGLHILSPDAPYADRLRFSFDVFDLNSDGLISPTELRAMLQAAFTENDVPIGPMEIQHMVQDTFDKHDFDGDGYLSWDEYQTMASKNPHFLRPLTLHTAVIIDSRLREVEEAATSA